MDWSNWKIIWISNFTYEFYDLFFNLANNLILNWYTVIFIFPNNTLKIILKNRLYLYVDNNLDFEKIWKNIFKILLWESSSDISKYIINFSKENNIKNIFFENWYFPNTLQIDTLWQNQMSSIYNLKYEEILNYKRNIIKNITKIKLNKFNITLLEKIKIFLRLKNTIKSISNFLKYKKLEIVRKKILNNKEILELKDNKYIFIPFQVHDDSQILLYSDIIKKMDDILSFFYNDIREILPDYKIIIKEHPMDLWRINYSKIKEKYNDIIWIQGWDLNNIINKSEYVIVVNSSVWLQCLEKGKKVLLLWNAIYQNNPFIEKINSISDFRGKLLKLKNKEINKLEIDKYIDKFKNEIFFNWSYKNFNENDLNKVINFIIN